MGEDAELLPRAIGRVVLRGDDVERELSLEYPKAIIGLSLNRLNVMPEAAERSSGQQTLVSLARRRIQRYWSLANNGYI